MIVLATDHAGFKLKEAVKAYLLTKGYDVYDVGAHELKKKDDYPSYMAKAARLVAKNPDTTKAIIFGSSGQGEAMTVNIFKDVRGAVYYGGPLKIVKLSREHNNANVLSLGASFLTKAEAQKAAHLFLTTDFTKAVRHKRRLAAVRRLKQ